MLRTRVMSNGSDFSSIGTASDVSVIIITSDAEVIATTSELFDRRVNAMSGERTAQRAPAVALPQVPDDRECSSKAMDLIQYEHSASNAVVETLTCASKD